MATGVAGSGKTALCQALAEQSDGSTFTALILGSVVSEEHLISQVLEDFGLISVENRGSERLAARPEMLDALDRFLRGLRPIKASATLIVDDAERVPMTAMKQIARLARIEAKGEPLLQIVLVGTPELNDVLTMPELSSLEERIAARFELDAPVAEPGPEPESWFERRVPPIAAFAAVLLGSVLAVGVSTFVYQRLGF